MKRLLILASLLLTLAALASCSKEEKKPFGAEVVNYDKVEGINKDGPVIETQHFENTPPMGDKTVIVEVGPPHVDFPDIKVEPTADLESDPDYGGIPIVTRGNGSNGS